VLEPSPSPTPHPITGRIAYVHNSGEVGGVPSTDIWILGADGVQQPIPLTNDPQNEWDPFWLLDGSRLVFAVDSLTNPYEGRLVSVLPDGSDRKDLAPVSAVYRQVALSPDGRYVVWGAGTGITLLDRATGEARLLTHDGGLEPIWSPDGKAILIREPSFDAVAVVTVPAGHLTRFVKKGIESLVGWSGDGASVAFTTGSGDSTPTWLAPRAGGAIVPFPPNLDLASATWSSPDGRFTIGSGFGAGAFSVSTTDVNVKATVVGPGLAMLAGSPSWAPDDSAFAFAGGTTDEVADQKSGIYVVGLGGQAPARITNGPLDTSPAWDPAS
jgi:Tol biopolymer transport system component